MAQIDLAHERASAAVLVLLVEDNFLLGLDVQAALEQSGYEVLGPAATVVAALAVIRFAKLDAAVLDLNLAGEKSFAVADELAARNIPFVITSGYSIDDLPAKYRQCAVLAKPFLPRELSRCLEQAIILAQGADAGRQALRQR